MLKRSRTGSHNDLIVPELDLTPADIGPPVDLSCAPARTHACIAALHVLLVRAGTLAAR
jgi:hypothetical protein